MESTTDQAKAQQPTETKEEVKQQQDAPTDEDIVTSFGIQAATNKGIDYDKLIERFGCYPITDEIKQKIEQLTGRKPHRFIRRNIFFCHRDLDLMLKKYEDN